MQRNVQDRGGFLRGAPGDQSAGSRIGPHMAQQPGAHVPHAPPRPPSGHMQPHPPPGPPQGGGGFHSRPQDAGHRRPAAPGQPFTHPSSGTRSHHQGQGMRPQPPMGMNRNVSNVGAHDRGNHTRGLPVHVHSSKSNSMTGSKQPMMGGGQSQAPHALPNSMAAPHAPRLRATDTDFEDLANVVVAPQDVNAVGYVERLRAMNALAKVGASARAEHSAAAIKAAAGAFRSGAAFKGTAYAEDVTMYVPSSVGAGTATRTATD